tara:strand:+ start:1239 stop:1943 length:705 start_codon:yes stop_codon:yes gene_type:complete
MKPKNIMYFLFLICILLVGCDSLFLEYDCNGDLGGTAIIDDCGICSLGDTGLEENANMSCDGECSQDAIFWDMSALGNGFCDTGINSFAKFNCEKTNCDNGDCGEWDGTQCLGPNGKSAIKITNWTTNNNLDSLFITNDPSIIDNFLWNTYYKAIPGTYTFSYPNSEGILMDGTYTTYINEPLVDSNNIEYECFELSLYSFGSIFSNYSFLPECIKFWEDENQIFLQATRNLTK